jgi:hypothetical protein
LKTFVLMIHRRLLAPLFLGAALLLWPHSFALAANQPMPVLPAPGAARPGQKPLPAATMAKPAAGTNVVSASQTGGGKGLSGLTDAFTRAQKSPLFYPAVGVVALALVALLIFRASKAKKAAAAVPSAQAAAQLRRKASRGAVHSCNILQTSAAGQQLWQFDAHGGSLTLSREQTSAAGEPLPARLVARDWRSLFRRRLNVAWLQPEDAFLRVVHLPLSDFNETLSMVELQLEKLSPMPITQIVWSFHVLPHAKGNLQTVVVMFVARDVVEEFLGKLENQGYLPDRLDLPTLDQLQATSITEDGAWVYPEPGAGSQRALVAWWYGGVLQTLDLLTLPPANRPASLKEQLLQMAWAGELDNWLTAPPSWHLVADDASAKEWEPALKAGLDQPIRVQPPLAAPELAALNARRATEADPAANLLPVDYTARYQQQFVDRLWMRGLGAIIGLYLVGVAIYGVALGYASYRALGKEGEVARLGSTYTNAIVLRDRSKVLKERAELKYLGLDCWKTTAALLPPDVTLESLDFGDGKRLRLNGSAPASQVKPLLDFDAAMRHAKLNGQDLFDPIKGEYLTYRANPGGSTVSWSISLELKRTEKQ